MRTSFLQKEDKTTCAANTAEFDKFFHILTNSDIHCWSLLRLQAKKAQASNCHKVEPQIADIPKPFLRDNLLWRHSSVSLHFHTFPTVKLVKLFWENPGTRKEQMILPFHGLHDLEFILFALHQPESAACETVHVVTRRYFVAFLNCEAKRRNHAAMRCSHGSQFRWALWFITAYWLLSWKHIDLAGDSRFCIRPYLKPMLQEISDNALRITEASEAKEDHTV